MKIGVVGLGISGLRTCMLLEEAGHEVTGFEARHRVGGRLHTVRTERGFYEAGGEWIDGHNRRILDLLGQFGYEPELAKPEASDRLWFHGAVCEDIQEWPEIGESTAALEEAAAEMVLDMEDVPWENVLHYDIDHMSLASMIQRHAVSPKAESVLRAIYRSEEGDEAEKIGLLGWLSAYHFYLERSGGESSSYRFPEGAEHLCDRMREKIQGALHFGCPITMVEQLPNAVVLHSNENAETFDRVVITLPPPAIRNLMFSPDLGVAKQDAIDSFQLGRTIKVALRFRRRFWLEKNWSGRLLSDQPAQQCWDGSRNGEAVLLCYLTGEEAERTAQADDPVARVLDSISTLFPEAKEEFLDGMVHDWVGDPWAGGGFPYLHPGAVLESWADLIRAEGRLHFAGDATSTWIGYIEGALESAERVAAEIPR